MQNADDRLVEIARIGKAHGLTGDVRILISDDAIPFLKKHSLFYLKNRRGDLIPARLTGLRIEDKRNVRSFFVKFDRIADRSQAESFQDTPVYIDYNVIAEDPEQNPETIIGFKVTDEAGPVGTVQGIIQNPAHPIIEVEMTEPENRIVLVPWVDEYVVSINKKHQYLECRNLHILKDL